MIEEIVCGGQTGVDLAAAQAALDVGIPQGGFCPKGRFNEAGIIPERFNFTEISIRPPFTPQENIDRRTVENIRHSDGTLIVVPTLADLAEIQDGTKLTNITAQKLRKPLLHIALSDTDEKNSAAILAWVTEHNIRKLNVAGPRESTSPGVYAKSLVLFKKTFPEIKVKPSPVFPRL